MNQKIIDKYFLLQEINSTVEIKLEVEELNKEIEFKLIGLLNTAYFAVKNNIQINLEDILHIPPTTLLILLDFAREMEKEGRTTSIVNVPESIEFFIRHFGFEHLLKLP